MPKLLDMCAVFTAVDLVMTQKAVRNVMQAQPKYHDDLNDAVPLVCDLMHAFVSCFVDLNTHTPPRPLAPPYPLIRRSEKKAEWSGWNIMAKPGSVGTAS